MYLWPLLDSVFSHKIVTYRYNWWPTYNLMFNTTSIYTYICILGDNHFRNARKIMLFVTIKNWFLNKGMLTKIAIFNRYQNFRVISVFTGAKAKLFIWNGTLWMALLGIEGLSKSDLSFLTIFLTNNWKGRECHNNNWNLIRYHPKKYDLELVHTYNLFLIVVF